MPLEVDLTTCDREPIHIPGSIQSHGCMLACDAASDQILRCSENAADFLSQSLHNPLGARLSEFFSADVAHDLRNVLAQTTEPRRPGLILKYQLSKDGPSFDISAHRYGGAAIIEFEHAAEQRKSPLDLARILIARTQSLSTIEQMARQVPRYLQAVLEYDRVMIYQFAEDGSGKVIARGRSAPHLESFLGQHFPASDIPQQARVLYLENTIRVIDDAQRGRGLAISRSYDARGRALDLVLRPSAQRLADPSRISAQHGRRGLDVAVDHGRRRVVGPDRLPSLRAEGADDAAARRGGDVRRFVLAAGRGFERAERAMTRRCAPARRSTQS